MPTAEVVGSAPWQSAAVALSTQPPGSRPGHHRAPRSRPVARPHLCRSFSRRVQQLLNGFPSPTANVEGGRSIPSLPQHPVPAPHPDVAAPCRCHWPPPPQAERRPITGNCAASPQAQVFGLVRRVTERCPRPLRLSARGSRPALAGLAADGGSLGLRRAARRNERPRLAKAVQAPPLAPRWSWSLCSAQAAKDAAERARR